MAKYAITYRCGHEDRVSIEGPQKDRAWKLEREATKDCPACFINRREAARAEAATTAQATNIAQGLAALTGSPKQIAWAEQIRAAMQPGFAQLRTQLEAVRATAKPEQIAALEGALATLDHETRAAWWIDHQSFTAANLVRALMTGEVQA